MVEDLYLNRLVVRRHSQFAAASLIYFGNLQRCRERVSTVRTLADHRVSATCLMFV